MQCGAAGALAALGIANPVLAENADDTTKSPYPLQVPDTGLAASAQSEDGVRGYDMRDELKPRRLTFAMWDVAYALRHGPDGSFSDYDHVLDQAVERGYNTIRFDPMPEWIDLSKPGRVLDWPNPHVPYMPWNWNTAVHGPVGDWLIEFVDKLLKRPFLHYTLSAWWFGPGQTTVPNSGPPMLRVPANMMQGAEMWAAMLHEWKKRFGFDRLIYVDIANETPYFFPNLEKRFREATGKDFNATQRFSAEQVGFLVHEIDPALALLRREFPELRFTTSIHGDKRWFDVPLQLDCLDVHFYADADPRWTQRTRFGEFAGDHLFETDKWFAEFSKRCAQTAQSMAPMLRARQRYQMAQFSDWAIRLGTPITTSEGWASWYYIDNPNLDWGWLLDWSAWAVEDAIACGFWGWTPNNYAQPQFAIWKNILWQRTLNERFLGR
jgi:hypothetical protein